jgi:hypothetical protein
MTNFAHRAFDRRDFLRLMGLGTGAFFLPSLAGRSTARAQPMAPPRRLLVIYANASWTTRVGDLAMRPPWGPVDDYALYDFQRNRIVPDPNSWTFDFTDPRLEEAQMSRVLAPFWRHRRKMTAIEGLGLLSAGLDPFGDGHAKAHAHGLTGAPAAYDFDGVKSWASQPSIDQRVHEHLLRTEPSLVSLDFRAWQDRAGPAMFHEMLYRSDPAGGVTRVTPETNPEVAFARLFEGRGPAVDGRDLAQSISVAPGQRERGLRRSPRVTDAADLLKLPRTLGADPGDGEAMVAAGLGGLLGQPEFRNSGMLLPLVQLVDQGPRQLLGPDGETPQACGGGIWIGREHPNLAMEACAVVQAPYRTADGACGQVALVGPMRMAYATARAAVQSVATILQRLLS